MNFDSIFILGSFGVLFMFSLFSHLFLIRFKAFCFMIIFRAHNRAPFLLFQFHTDSVVSLIFVFLGLFLTRVSLARYFGQTFWSWTLLSKHSTEDKEVILICSLICHFFFLYSFLFCFFKSFSLNSLPLLSAGRD